jgi:large conductance mechanosensitive channel
MIKEFREFAVKGNMIDMAVGIIIGGAFGKIVSSLVNDVIMPPLGQLIGGVNFTSLKLTIGSVVEGKDPATLNYGNFIQTTVDFLIVAWAVFMMVKAINAMKRKEAAAPAAPAAPPAPTKDQQLLAEIRDLLKARP